MGQIATMHTPQLYFHYSIDTQSNADSFHLHCHNNYEIYMFVQGNGNYRIEGRHYALAPYHLLLMRPGEFHCVQLTGEEPYVRYALHFSSDLLDPDAQALLLSPFNDRPLGSANLYARVDRQGIPVLFERLAAACTLPAPARELFARHLLCALLAQLSCMRQPASAPMPTQDVAARTLEYLHTHLTEPITLDMLAAHLFVSKHYLGRRFRELTGTSVLDYVIRKRVALAQQWIVRGDALHIAASRAGFGDYSVFYRAYKRITGHTPKQDQHT